MMSELDFTKTQLGVLFIIILLAVDSVNPVKMFMHVFPSVAPWHIATIMLLLMFYIFVSEMKELLYFSVKIFFHSILSIFFRDVQIIGRDNIPRHGPVIFTSNHANQFIDGVTVLCTCEHKISYLVAEKSWNRRIIGDISWAMGAVPVKRAQDSAKKGTGTVLMQRSKDNTKETGEEESSAPKLIAVEGMGTLFLSELAKSDKIRLPNSSMAFKVIRVDSETSLQVEDADESLVLPAESGSFDILKHIDQKIVYEKVLEKMAHGGAIGIFPEGGSHDRTDLLPLKVGVALIAYSALEQDGLSIPIVPVGLNYFRSYHFRGRAIVEYGRPTFVDPSTLSAYKTGGTEKRRVCNELLQRIQDSMRSVIVSTPDYETLELIHTARRLYERKDQTTSEKQDLSRRFAEGYKQLLLRTAGKPPQQWLSLQSRLISYQSELNELGIRDYQVPGLRHEKVDIDGDTVLREMRIPYHIVHLVLMLLLAALPTILLNFPVGIIARLYANRRRKVALANSKVKVKGLDVVLSEKVVICIVLVPTLWFAYGLALKLFTNLDGPSIALIIMSLPICSYMGIVVAQAGMVGLKDLRPYVMRLFPSARRRLAALPAARKELQEDLREFIRELGPSLGEIYYGKDLDWAAIKEESRSKVTTTGEPTTSKDDKKEK